MSLAAETTVSRSDLAALADSALTGAGFATRTAAVLTEAALFAEDRGRPEVGVTHLLDYLRAAESGSLNPAPAPVLTRVAPGLISCSADKGPFHTGFDAAFGDLVEAARSLGVVAFVQSEAFASGQLGWFTERLASAGLAAVGAVNSNALLSTAPGTGRVLGTNPLAYSFPSGAGRVVTVDQASSATAYVNIRRAAEAGESIPEGWAVDADGRPATDPVAALTGALLPFGGYKGANIAWLVELLATMSGANWSVDAPPFDAGPECPSVGMFLLGVDLTRLAPAGPERIGAHLERIAGLGIRPPGSPRAEPRTEFTVADPVLATLREYAARPPRTPGAETP
ncbi:Ldh family oxidoreductase [Gordonia sp. FQ]|uniref:Ldh family oxidoreductase n=1 Tax=Gordonia sp. FQ TaxID=3446634 RepID=UPI003F8788BA